MQTGNNMYVCMYVKVGKVLTARENPGGKIPPRNGSTGQYLPHPPIFIMKYFKTACIVVLLLKLNIF